MTLALNHSSANMDNKYQPAYKGAKFDKSGYCIKHPMIRLCKPSRLVPSEDEESSRLKPQLGYVVVRKTCPMCGEHSLRNERKFSKVKRAQGYQQPERQPQQVERHVEYYRSSASTVSTAIESPPSSPDANKRISSSNSVHGALISSGSTVTRSKNLEDRFAATGERLPLPPVRNSRSLRESYASVDSNESLRTPGLAGKVVRDGPNASTRREKSVPRSTSRRESVLKSASNESERPMECRSRGRSITSKTKSSRREDDSASVSPSLEWSKSIRHRSSSRRHRHTEERFSSSVSVGPHSTKTSFSRKNSNDALTARSLCHLTSSRRGSAPHSFSNLETIYGGNDFDFDRNDREFSSFKASTMKRNEYESSVDNLSEDAASLSSSQKNIESPVHRRRSILSSSHMGGRSKSRSKNESSQIDQKEERSLFSRGRSKSKPKINHAQSEEVSIFSRGRSKSKSRRNTPTEEETEETSIFSARRSFANSLTRRRSLSRNASRVLKTTSTMDGNKDAEPCIQLYEVPFNPMTGRCHYHPEISLAVRAGGKKGGWKMVRDCCPKCSMY